MTHTKTYQDHHRRTRKGVKTTPPPVWRPQPTGLTRDEIRRIVLDTIG